MECLQAEVLGLGDWPVIVVILAVGIVIGVVGRSDCFKFWRHHSEIVESGGQLGCRQRVHR